MARGRWDDDCHSLLAARLRCRTVSGRISGGEFLFYLAPSSRTPPALHSTVLAVQLCSGFLRALRIISATLRRSGLGFPVQPRSAFALAIRPFDPRRDSQQPPSAQAFYPEGHEFSRTRPTFDPSPYALLRRPFASFSLSSLCRHNVLLEPRSGSVAPRLQRSAETRRCLGIHGRRPRIPHLHGQVVHEHRRHQREHLRGYWEPAARRLLPPARSVVAG